MLRWSGAGSALRLFCDVGTMFTDPRLDVVGEPYVAHLQRRVRLRETPALGELIHAGAADAAQAPADLGRAHQLERGALRWHSMDAMDHRTVRPWIHGRSARWLFTHV